MTSNKKKRKNNNLKNRAKRKKEEEELRDIVLYFKDRKFFDINLLRLVPFGKYSLSFILWTGSLSLIFLFINIFMNSNNRFNSSGYFLNINNIGFQSLIILPIYAFILLIFYFFVYHETLEDEEIKELFLSQTKQINFMLPILFSVVLLVLDRTAR